MEQGTRINRAILDPIRWLQQGNDDEEDQERQQQHRLVIDSAYNVNRQSVQYLVTFLSGDTHQVTELDLSYVSLVEPPDGGLDVLIDFFTNQTTLTKVKLDECDFGGTEEASQLVAAFQRNRSVTDLTIDDTDNLYGTAFGNCISGLLQNMPQLQRLSLGNRLDLEALRAMQPGLRTNRHLKILALCRCFLGNEGLRLIVDALVGNTTMEVLDLSQNYISSDGLVDITRLLELTQLKKIGARYNPAVFRAINLVQLFTHALHQHTSLEELSGFEYSFSPQHISPIKNDLARNTSIRRAKGLLALQARTGLPIASKSGTWYMAFGKFATRFNGAHTGASAIYKILQARPAILEKQLRRPAAAAAATACTAHVCTSRVHPQISMQTRQHDSPANGGGIDGGNSSVETAGSENKRQRLS